MIRLCLVLLVPLFIVTVVIFPVGLFLCTPVYWLITGRDYFYDIIDAIEYCAE